MLWFFIIIILTPFLLVLGALRRNKTKNRVKILILVYWPLLLFCIEFLFLNFASVYCPEGERPSSYPYCNILGIDASAHLNGGTAIGILLLPALAYVGIASVIWAIVELIKFLSYRVDDPNN